MTAAELLDNELCPDCGQPIKHHPEDHGASRQAELAERTTVQLRTSSALIALLDAIDDPVVSPGIRLSVLALNAELTTRTQQQLLVATLYELADAITRITS